MKHMLNVHNEAMDMWRRGRNLRQLGRFWKGRKLQRQAYAREKEVARFYKAEPSRSIFYKSAITMGYGLGMYHDAQELVKEALNSEGIEGSAPREVIAKIEELEVAISAKLGTYGGESDLSNSIMGRKIRIIMPAIFWQNNK